MKYWALVTSLLTCTALAMGDTAVIKADNDETNRGMVAINIQSDGASLDVGSNLSDTNYGTHWAMITNYDVNVTLIGWKGMFEALPQIASRDSILSATLKVYQRGPVGDETIQVNRVTSQWLILDAGSNETAVTGIHRAAGQYWAGGASVGFSSLDYTTQNAAQFSYTEAIFNKANYVDVTEIVKDIYQYGNQGFVLRQVGGTPDPWMQGDEKTDVGSDGYQVRPALYIEYSTGSPHTLTVNSGSGDGQYYVGTAVPIAADAAPSGQAFLAWIGDTAGIADVHAPSTSMTMPNNNATITATYSQSYLLTVNSGLGDGTYATGAVVAISADAAPPGKTFNQWTGDVGAVANVGASSTTVTMPAANVTVTATYVDAPGHYLTVLSGTGGGTYPTGTIVPIAALPAPSGQQFYRWVGDTAGVANLSAASTTYTMPATDAKIGAYYRDIGATAYTIYQNLDAVTDRIYRLVSQPFLDLIDANRFYQTETIIYHDVETGKETWSLTRELCTDLANIERRTAWSSNGQYISFIGNKAFWDYRNNSLWDGSWAGYTYIANSDSSKRRKLWANGPGGLASYQDKFNNWDMATPNYLYYPSGNRLVRVTLGPGNNDHDNTAEYIYTFANSNSRIIQEIHDWNYLLVEESGSSPNCYVFNLNLPPSDPKFCMSYPLAGAVHPGSFRFRRSDLIVTGGYEAGGSICLKVDLVNGVLIPWTLPSDPYGEIMWHLWYGPPDDRVCFSGTALGQSFGLWVQLPGNPPIKVGNVCDGHPTWCGHDPDWAFYSSGTNEGEQPNVDPRYDRRIVAPKADGSEVRVLCKPWDRRRGGTQGYDAIPRPNQSPDATKCWYHSSMLNSSDSYTGSYIVVFRKPHAPTAVSYSGGAINWTPHALAYEVKSYRVYRNTGSGWQFVQEVPKSQTTCPAGTSGTYMVTSLEWCGLESDLSSPTVTVPGGTVGGAVSGWDTTPPAKPTNLQVVKVTAGRYRLTWQAPADQDLRYFNVYFSSLENPQAIQQRRIVSPPKSETTYLDWTAPVGGSAFYGITAVDYQGNESQPAYVEDVAYTLTVNSGTGSGSYAPGTVVNIAANAAPSGKTFDKWVGDTAGIADVNAASTTITIPASNATITATYKNLYALTVNSGSGSSSYVAGTVVNITANAAPSGKTFDKWMGDTSGIANVNASSTTITMPAANQTITAAYKDILYALTVNSGAGGGSYAASTVVPIIANAASTAQVFDKWVGDTAYVANVNAASTSVTMPAANVTVTATYDSLKYALTVNSGSGSGTYAAGAVVAIVADAPPSSGMVFKAWTGDTACVANATAASTTLTMPAANAALTATYRFRGDVNGDGFVGQTDLDIVLGMWGRSGSAITDKRADIDFNNFVGQGDLDVVLGQWGKGARP